jgi:hypothetical protein
MQISVRAAIAALWVLCLLPGDLRAQSALSGSIAGVVKDTTGAVLPGVTVEASSPALIEKVRTAVTDAEGQYKILDLRPGSYAVTFTLAGFNVFKREGIELTTGFTATANAEMKVGALEETITVTGASPVVDIQNVRQQAVLSKETLDTIPTGKTIQGYATMLPAAVLPAAAQDVGGNRGELTTSFGVHGGRGNDLKLQLDGMGFNTLPGSGGGLRNFTINQVSTQEVAMQTDAMSAEVETGGVQLNVVPKEGGNRFALYGLATYTNADLQTSNMTDELRTRGLPSDTPVKKVYDYGFGIGGPLKRDRLWFYSGHRWWGSQQTLGGTANGYFNSVPDSWFYVPDLSRPSYRWPYNQDNNIRVTWQAAPKHKVNLALYVQDSCTCYAQIETRAPEAATHNYWKPNNMFIGTWSHPASNRLLLDAGASYYFIHQPFEPPAESRPNAISVTEQSTGIVYRAYANLGSNGYGFKDNTIANQRASMSYVTGSHAFKVGLQAQEGWYEAEMRINQDVSYTFNRGIPVSVTQYATPWAIRLRLQPNLGIYAQDQWTTGRLTLNLGLRFDQIKEHVPAVSLAAGPFVPAREFPKVEEVPNWKDITPRLGGAYDVFGNGKTAVKASLGKYLEVEGATVANSVAPVNAMVVSANRAWADANGDFVPQANELGALSNAAFGQVRSNTTWSDDVLHGWGKRGYNWEGSVVLQHELRPGVGLSAGYYRRWYGNFRVTDNLSASAADYQTFCVNAPTDARLGSVSGSRICGLFDVVPAKFGQVNNLVTRVSDEIQEHYDGVDFGVTSRFVNGASLQGGFATGRSVIDACAVTADASLTNPTFTAIGAATATSAPHYCHNAPAFGSQAQLKLSGVYPLPAQLQVSATYQDLPGLPILASFVATNAQIAPSLGRNLAACGAAATCTSTATVDLIEPNTMFEDRIRQVDLRFSRTFAVRQARLKGMFDVYNVFNASPILSMTTRYGAAWLQPSLILGGRLLKFGVQIDY